MKSDTLLQVVNRYRSLVLAIIVVIVVLMYVPSLSKKTSSITPNNTPFTPATPTYGAGVTVSGVHCGPGIRQVPWSHYAPGCKPVWHGYNGGATSHGVTAKTITLTYRIASTAEEKSLESMIAPGVVGTNKGVIRTMQAYIKVFNKDFELYGRHVVLKVFRGKGDFLQEDLGQGQAQAQADAQTAYSLGAFADSSVLGATQEYIQALAGDHVIAIGAQALSQSWFEQFAPYEYSPFIDCNKGVQAAVDLISRSLAGMPAIFAGEPAMRSKNRVFGIFYPQSPQIQLCAQQAVSELHNLGINVPVVVSYSFDITSAPAMLANGIAKMKQAGVTTVLCACDPFTPMLIAQAANSQQYYPEWVTMDYGDAFGRFPALKKQWAHAISAGLQSLPEKDQEAYQVFKMADPKGRITPEYGFVYPPLLLFFDALQAAGPDLTPQTFEQGYFSLPNSIPNGSLGGWSFGKNSFDPPSDFRAIWWNPNAISAQDGKKGAWINCNNGTPYYIANKGAGLPKHQQLNCFNRLSTGG